VIRKYRHLSGKNKISKCPQVGKTSTDSNILHTSVGETESWVSRGITDDADCVFGISGEKLRTLFVNRVLKTNSFCECVCALKIALTRSTFHPKKTMISYDCNECYLY